MSRELITPIIPAQPLNRAAIKGGSDAAESANILFTGTFGQKARTKSQKTIITLTLSKLFFLTVYG